MAEILCPCCNQPVRTGQVPVESLLECPLTPIELDIIDKLVTRYPGTVRRDALLEYVYAFRKEPENSLNSLKVALSKLRKKLPAYGWKIVNPKGNQSKGPGNYGCYRLEPVDE